MSTQRPRYGTVEEIRAIRWTGDREADRATMEAVSEFVRRNRGPDPEASKDALHAMRRDGMGLDEGRPDDECLAEYLRASAPVARTT